MTGNAKPTVRDRYDLVVVDPAKLRWHIDRTTRSISRFAVDVDSNRNSIYRMLRRTPVRRDTVAHIAEQLDVRCDELLESTPVPASPEAETSPWEHPEWQIVVGTQLLHRAMSNGLVMQVAKVRHRVLTGEFGRAKVYDITGVPAGVRDQYREALSRHASVSRLLGESPYIARNLTMTSLRDESLWTSVDRWVDSHSLSDELIDAPLPPRRVAQVVGDVAAGCELLHSKSILLRELHPDHILVRSRDGRCLLADLELAKLLEVEATVSSRWQPNLYRAPEISGGENHYEADLHSCARLLVHLLTGELPDFPGDTELLHESLPESVAAEFLASCLSPNWRKRPGSIAELRATLSELELPNE